MATTAAESILTGWSEPVCGREFAPAEVQRLFTGTVSPATRSLLDCVINASGGVVGKVTDWALSKAPDGVHQSDVAFLNQIQHGNARGGVFLCNAHDLGKVTLN